MTPGMNAVTVVMVDTVVLVVSATLLVLAAACAPPAVSVGYVASPTPPRWLSPTVEVGEGRGRAYGFVGYEAVIQAAKPSYGPIVGMSWRVWP